MATSTAGSGPPSRSDVTSPCMVEIIQWAKFSTREGGSEGGVILTSCRGDEFDSSETPDLLETLEALGAPPDVLVFFLVLVELSAVNSCSKKKRVYSY